VDAIATALPRVSDVHATGGDKPTQKVETLQLSDAHAMSSSRWFAE
jgi:hypothetical protein